jgi:hypothetical protein
MRLATFAIGSLLPFTGLVAGTLSSVTFHKDVEPIFQRNCQICHRVGQVAPMSLTTYESARPWAKAIKAAVATKKMPPWFAEGEHFGQQRPKITAAEINTIISWVDSGAVEGDAKDAPKPLHFDSRGWTIRPDMIIDMPISFEIPAKGVIPWMDYMADVKIDKDIYVAAGEILPEAVSYVHHVVLNIVPPSPQTKFLDNWDTTKMLPADQKNWPGRLLAIGWSPGENPQRYDMDHSCMFIPAGSHLVFNVHYNTNGTPTKDRSKAAFELCKGVPKNLVTYAPDGGETTWSDDTVIPAGNSYYPKHREINFTKDVEIAFIEPHMHLRGKDFKYTLTYPNGKKEDVLWVPRYDYNWQIVYYPDKPLKIPAGSKLEMDGHWDNSANNKDNPDPTVDVKMGLQAWEEMFGGIVYVIIPKDMDPKSIEKPVASLSKEYQGPPK